MSETTLDEAHLQQWVGKSESFKDTLHPAQACLMQTTLDRNPSLVAGDPLPPLWHWTYFHSGVPLSDLGRDGHPALGKFLPPVALPRRMWAGSRLKFETPILLGETITKTSTIKNVSMKSGRSGDLCFVTVEHIFTTQKGDLRISEEHDIVYKQDPTPGAPSPTAPEPPRDSQISETITPSTIQLFRYSALTFNSHRIHYDREYCKTVEGYPGLIFHGPLAATLLADMAYREGNSAPLKTFSFRAMSPLFDTAPFTIHSNKEGTYWAQNPDGNLAMKAEVEI